jgi:hypothetical protein
MLEQLVVVFFSAIFAMVLGQGTHSLHQGASASAL